MSRRPFCFSDYLSDQDSHKSSCIRCGYYDEKVGGKSGVCRKMAVPGENIVLFDDLPCPDFVNFHYSVYVCDSCAIESFSCSEDGPPFWFLLDGKIGNNQRWLCKECGKHCDEVIEKYGIEP